MAKKMLIDATHPEETRVVVVDGTKVEEFDFETVNRRQISGNIYLAKVTRVEPSLQAAFVDYGGNRHGFLAFAEIHPDYYQIPAADREALMAEERAYAEALEAEEAARPKKSRRSRPAKAEGKDETVSAEVALPEGADDAASAGDPVQSQDADGAAEQPTSDAVPVVTQDQGDAGDDSGDDANTSDDGEAKDDSIESVADEDVTEEIRAPRKPRPRRYKIQEVIKVRQIMLVQVVKEERGNKGAALTTYLSLAGRYCVLMPNTARGGGISRKITNASDRKKLKDIASELDVPKGAGLIIRTAGSQRTRTEIRRDYEYLLRLWEQIRDLTFKSVAPAAIYEEGDLIKRTIRDLYSKEIDEVLVEGERGYRTAKDFMKMIMPSHAKNVKHYGDQMPLFARYQVESYLGGMFNPVVQLKSGGYIVIGVTEALVAIDVNSGRATKEGSIEDTALKTNLEAADEVARQLRLRDLAGLIVIDFIDMEERKNNTAVEKRMKDRLKSDRARIQVGRISGFGLMEMSRQRLRPGMLESTTQPCPHCHGTGLIRSDDSLALTILRAIEEEGTRKRSREVLVKAPVAVSNFLINAKREHIAGVEQRYGMAVRVEADPALVSPDFVIEKFKTATRFVPEASQAALSVDAELMAQIDDEDDLPESEEDKDNVAESRAESAEDDSGENGRSRRSRRRRRRRKSGDRSDDHSEAVNANDGDVNDADGALASDDGKDAAQDDRPEGAEDTNDPSPKDGSAEVKSEEQSSETPKAKSRSRSRSRKPKANPQPAPLPEVVDLRDQADDSAAEALPGVNQGYDNAASDKAAEKVEDGPLKAPVDQVEAGQDAAARDAVETGTIDPAPSQSASGQEEAVVAETAEPADVATLEPAPEPTPEPVVRESANDMAEPAAAKAPEAKPKRRGWWSAGR
ncbi:ribonuclease E/G [Paracoccus sp. Z330]|uniref:Ribonuclease E n=1 Tax=Paracoccus onchidii TaxID=3017813 RepID=A0ABT4ZDW6_9RHOB|nr:ribonuclease E/G [Paracoccus onchidii]MDB6177539.1 ribonuclease E/G [Paracoccus onchidii]